MKIIILSSARSGSNYLTKLLHTCSPYNKTLLFNEPFNYDVIQTLPPHELYVKKIIERCETVDHVILKTHLNQLYDIKNTSYRDSFLNSNIWYRILLLRKDLFKCSLSHAVASELNNFNDQNYTETTISINENNFLWTLENKIEYWIKFADFKKLKNYNKIVYFEDFLFDPTVDIKNLNLPFKNNLKKRKFINEKTPYNLITILNKDRLKEIFDNRMDNFSCHGIQYNNGLLELE